MYDTIYRDGWMIVREIENNGKTVTISFKKRSKHIIPGLYYKVSDIVKYIALDNNVPGNLLLQELMANADKFSEPVRSWILFDKAMTFTVDSGNTEFIKREIKRVTRSVELMIEYLYREVKDMKDFSEWVWKTAVFDKDSMRFVKSDKL